jgi:hypothetical protein
MSQQEQKFSYPTKKTVKSTKSYLSLAQELKPIENIYFLNFVKSSKKTQAKRSTGGFHQNSLHVHWPASSENRDYLKATEENTGGEPLGVTFQSSMK